LVFFAWPYTQSVDGNVKVDAFFRGFRPRVQSTVGVLSSLIALLVFAIMAWQATVKALESMGSGEIVDVIGIPVYPFQFFVAVGVSALCLQLMIDVVRFFRRKGGA
jgi:TRAP-type mannitol/chloroaromatic compound transport system permease small subunit